MVATPWIQSYPCKNKSFAGGGEESTKISRAVTKAQSYLVWQFIRMWQILWRFIMESSNVHTISLRNKRNCRTSYTTSKRGEHQPYYCNLDWTKSGWSDSMECCCYLRNDQDLMADGKTPYERRFGESIKGPNIPFGALVENLPNSRRDKARIHQFGQKLLPGFFLKICFDRGREFGKETFWLLILKNRKSWMHQKHIPEDWMQKKSWYPRKTENLQFLWQMVQQITRKRLRFPRNHSETWTYRKGEGISVENLNAIGKSFNLKKQKMTKKHKRIFGLFKVTSSVVIILNREFNNTCREKNRSLFHWFTLISSGQLIPIWTKRKKKRIDDCWNVDGNRNLSDFWTGFTRFALLNETPPKGFLWSSEDWQKSKRHHAEITYGLTLG